MAIPSQQIGWSQKDKLLWNISKQLEQLTQVFGNIQIDPVVPTTTTTTTIAPSGNFILTENSDPIITEDNNNLIIE